MEDWLTMDRENNKDSAAQHVHYRFGKALARGTDFRLEV
jgi:hypothetical protein